MNVTNPFWFIDAKTNLRHEWDFSYTNIRSYARCNGTWSNRQARKLYKREKLDL
jgi:hypothetical protein